MYLNDYEIDEAIRNGEEARKIIESPLYKKWVENVQNDLMHLLEVDFNRRSVESEVWYLRGAYAFRMYLEMVVRQAEQAKEQRKGRQFVSDI